MWADVDTQDETPSPASAVSFRESLYPADLQKANREVIYAFDLTNIELTWAFIVTWYNVTFYRDEPSRQIRNSFQAVLTTNGENSFVIFYYNKIQWTTGTASNGNNQGLGGTAAQVGFDAGDGTNRYMLNVSCTKEVLYVNNLSNIGIPGEYVFQVDSNIIQTPPLITRPTRSTLPPLSTIATTATTICECTRKNIYLDIVAVMDNSQSMAEGGIFQIQGTLAMVIGGLTINSSPGDSSRIALVTFASNAINVAGLNAFNNTDTFEEILFGITVLNDSNVDIISGLQMANTILSKNTDRKRVVILYTSAYDDADFQNPVPLALNMRKDNIRIITVAFSQYMGSDEVNNVGKLAWPGFNFDSQQPDIEDSIYNALCHSESHKDAKKLADTADRFQLSSNKISVNYDEIIGSGSTATVHIGDY
uniref:VWFA domain-containing protein n=1 Tax=Panagrolaimus davidi TaxID=227884 RepID=A0A914PZL8_9BILA